LTIIEYFIGGVYVVESKININNFSQELAKSVKTCRFKTFIAWCWCCSKTLHEKKENIYLSIKSLMHYCHYMAH